MKTLKLASLLFVLFLSACNDDEKQVKPLALSNTAGNANTSTTEKPEPVPLQGDVTLRVLLNDLRIRSAPSLNSSVVDKLNENASVTWLNEISSNTTPIKLRDVSFNDPWLKVKTPSGKEGWAYAAAVLASSNNKTTEQFKNKLYGQRSKYFFGTNVAKALDAYQQHYQSMNTAEALADAYTSALLLRDDMVSSLENKAMVAFPAMDMSWLSDVLPGFDVEHVAEGTQYYLFANYKTFARMAQATTGTIDDEFFKFAQTLYAHSEGNEGFFYNWFEQTWDYGGESLLGQGKHLKALEQMEPLFKKSQAFAQPLKHYKNDLVRDITNPDTKFKEPKLKMKQELQTILDKDFTLLTDADKKSIRNKVNSL